MTAISHLFLIDTEEKREDADVTNRDGKKTNPDC